MSPPPTIDGKVEPDEWKDVPSFDSLVDQQTGAPSPEGAEFWLGYDSRFIYFAAKLHDSQPKSIRAVEYHTNTALMNGDDTITLEIDLSGSLGDFSYFSINPKGATSLWIAGGRAAKREWLGEFQAAARITADGWELEARIPWQVLPLPGKGGRRNARFNVMRYISRLQQNFIYTYTGAGKTALTPIWGDVEMPAKAEATTLRMLPYVYAGYDKQTGVVANSGIDIKAPITQTINAVATVNPDFRNIENQVLSLDFSRFERLSSETRPFFLEGASYMSSNIYASQRFQRLDAGLNSYGKIDDKTSFGLIDTALPGSENDFAFNGTRQLDADSSARVTYTNQRAEGLKNNAYLVRYARNFGPFGIFGRYSATDDDLAGKGVEQFLNASYGKKEWNFYSAYDAVSDGYLPRLAFFPETDYKGVNLGGQYSKTFVSGPLIKVSFGADDTEYQRFAGGFYRRDWDAYGSLSLRRGPAVSFSHDQPNFEGQRDHLNGANLTYPAGNPYRFVTVGSNWGTQEELPYHSYNINSSYRVLGKLDLAVTYQALRFQGYADQLIFTMNYDMGRDRAISGRIVKQNDKVNPYLAFRRSGNSGIEYYLIVGDPNAQQFHSSVILKVTVPIERALGR